ncbi:hypothetical protein PHMEG_00010558 [Phytophthora megakarya]|uniref:Uncharacterized protein n=1 Tax=Phytophthora megakarya TaxID=4795 RepID=A0A225WDE7_9STRA|nr:hypothetical protein PHMEG_00010558 [Phytophthora megakarya]
MYQRLFTRYDWPNIRDVYVEWRQWQKLLLMLWRIHAAIVFYVTWRLRNDILFQETQAECPRIQSVTSSFRRHCQFIFRHATELGVDGEEVVEILHRLGFDEPTALTLPPPERRIWIPRL